MSVTTHPKPEGDSVGAAGRRLSRRIQARVMRAVNVPTRRVLALPVAQPLTDRLMLLYLTGRNTGRAYRHPVSCVSEGDVLARPEIISDVDQIEQSLAIIIRANPTAGRFVGAGTGHDGARSPAARDDDPPRVPDHPLAHRSRRSPHRPVAEG
jgi:hypothetical protein